MLRATGVRLTAPQDRCETLDISHLTPTGTSTATCLRLFCATRWRRSLQQAIVRQLALSPASDLCAKAASYRRVPLPSCVVELSAGGQQFLDGCIYCL